MENQSVICLYCDEEYNYYTLVQTLFTYNKNIPNDQKSQLDMQICGACRIANTICSECLWYGFSHPSNVNGKCPKCGELYQ